MLDLSELKLCFLVGTLGQGGAEQQLYYWLNTLKAAGTRLHVCCMTRGEFWEAPLAQAGIPVTWVGARPGRAARLARIWRETRQMRPHLIQSQLFYMNLYATLAARACGAREIGALRADAGQEVWSVGQMLGWLGLRAPRTIAANSTGAIETSAALGVPRERLHLLRNVVDTERFKPTARPANEVGARPGVTIAAIGRLVRQKRMDRLLAVFAQAQRQSPQPLQLILAGEGPLRQQLEQQAETLGIRAAVDFRGAVADAREIYAQADVLALTSDWEGTPNVVLEALACGLPVVATRVGGVIELVQHGETGFLIEPHDEPGFAAALVRLLADAPLRQAFGKRARMFAELQHGLPRLTGWLQEFYQQVLP